MNAHDFLSLAGKLAAAPGASEAACRTAVSRAYYAAFHLARSFLVSLGVPFSRDHGLPQRLLMAAGDPTSIRTGQHLGYLQTERIRADYDLELSRPIDREIAQHCVEVAHDFLAFLADCEQEPLRTSIKAGIEAYLKKLSKTSGS